jgi:alpha-tubulin suppressor-like RCC1 family protein
MVSSTRNLINCLNGDIGSISTDVELTSAQLITADDALQTASMIISVAEPANLPDPALNKGKMIFVLSISEYRYSNGVSWTHSYDTTLVYTNTLWTWGPNSIGQLGINTITCRSSPGTTAGGGTNWSSVSAGKYLTAAIKTDGTLWTWGINGLGQLGDGTITCRSSPGTTAGGGTNWISVSAGITFHTAGIKTDGTLWTWGRNDSGQLGDGTRTNRSSPGTTAGGGTNWSSVSGGDNHTAAIKTDGTLWTWGFNNCGKLGDGTITNRSSPGTTAGGGTNWSNVSGGYSHTAAVKTDGTLWTWGCNLSGQLGDSTITNRSGPGTTAGGGTNWSSVSAGLCVTAGIKTDGTLWTWGAASPFGPGQLGDGTATARSSPGTTAGGGTTWSSVSVALYHTAGIKTDGTLWTWGGNDSGRLGDGTTTNRSSPGTTSGGGTNWSSVSARAHTAVIQSIFISGFNTPW